MQGADLEEGRSRWPRRIAALAAVIVVGGCAAFFIHRAMAGGTTKTETLQPYTVGTMTLSSKVSTSGTAVSENEAALAFTIAGQVQTIYVKIGDSVTAGQPLVGLKADDLKNTTTTAQSALTMAQLRLQKLQEGATDTDRAKADEAVAGAQAALTIAQNDLQDATDPPTAAELTAAQQAVAAAEANLSAAEDKLDKLKRGASDADIAAAQAALDLAQSKLSQANTALDVAQDQEADAASAFEYAATIYCSLSDQVPASVCTANFDEPFDSETIHDLLFPTPTPVPNALLPDAIATLIAANNTYRSAIAAVDSANDAVDAATSGVDAAQEALDEAEDGASSDDIDSAKKAVDSAQATLDAAQAALQKLLDGPTATTILNLETAVVKAQVDLSTATTARDEIYAGAKATDLAMAQEDIHLAELTLRKANIILDNATLVSPFDGVVSALPVKIGQVVSPAISAVTVLTPGTLVLELNVGETELPSIQLGQSGTVTFDAIPTKQYDIHIYAISLSPETEQGIVIYKVRATIGGDLNALPNPSPGMSGSASIVTQQKADVIAIPSAAVHSRAGASVVDFIDSEGNISAQPVVTGLSDGDNIEVVKGLNVGDKIGMHTLPIPTKAAEGQEIPGHFQ
jgi:HlyD family secretion protein